MKAPNLRQEQKKKTRELLLKKGFEQFSKHGILNTKTLNIAQAAKVSHGALFAHFATRDALLLAVIDQFGMQIGLAMQSLPQTKGSLEDVLRTHLEILKEWEPFYTQIVLAGPHLPEIIRHAVWLIQSGIASHLEKALVQEKGLRKQVPVHFILNTWLGLVHYYLMNHDLFAPGKSVLGTKGKELIHNFVKLVQVV